MKKIFALLLALCLLPAMAMAAEVDISAMAGSQTFGDPEVTITGTAGSPLSLIFQDTVETVILKDVQFTAPADQYALLFKHSADESVKVIFKGTNAVTGGDDAIYSEGSVAVEPVDSAPSHTLTLTGGSHADKTGGSGIWAHDVSIAGYVTADGGNSEKSDGGAGVYAARDIDISGDVTATGGNSEKSYGGAGVYTEVGSVIISGMVTAAGGNSEEGCGGRGICAAYDIDISGTVKSAIGGSGAQGGGWGLRAGNINISGTVLKAIGGNSTNGTGGIALNAGKSINICGMVKSAVGGSSGRAGNSGISAQEGDIVISGVVESTVGGDAVEMRAGDGIQLGYGNLLITETGVVESAVGGDCVNGYNNRAGNGVFCSKGDATISGSLKAVGGNTVNIKGGDGITAKNITIGISGNVNAAGGNSEKSSAGFGASATENVEISGRLFAMSGIGGKDVKDVVAVSSKKLLLNDVSASESMDGRWWEKTRSSNMRFFSAPEMINPPLTGDDSQFGLWVLLMGMAGAAMLMLRKRARN